MDDPVIQEVCEYANDAIDQIKGDRVYLKKDKILKIRTDLFLISDQDRLIPIQTLFFSELGFYLNPFKYKGKPKWMCTACGRLHKTQPDLCEACGRNNFVVVYYER